MKQIAFFLFLILSAESFAAEILTFKGSLYLRSEPRFSRADRRYIRDVAYRGQTAVVLKKERLSSGNFQMLVQMQEGDSAGKKLWVYYNRKQPYMSLSEADIPEVKPQVVEVPEVEESQPAVTEAQIPQCTNCSPEVPVQEVSDALGETYTPAFMGALKTMAVMYQSCDVLNKPYINMGVTGVARKSHLEFKRMSDHWERSILPGKARLVARDHYYLQGIRKTDSSCLDMRKSPPLFTFGGRPRVTRTTIDILGDHNKEGDPRFSGMDCSAFVSSAFNASGLKLTPGANTPDQNFTISSKFYGYTKGNSCFTQPRFSSDTTIKSGDVVAWNGHVLMIDKVGEDPFGIERLKKTGVRIRSANSCDNLPSDVYKHFNFGIIQAAGDKNLAIMRSDAKSSGLHRRLLNLAIQACKAKFGAREVKRSSVNLIRHKGDSDPRCIMNKKPKLIGEECVASCT